MATYATITIGYNSFLLPAAEAQKCFEALTGRGVDVDYIGSESASEAGTTRGKSLMQNETRVSCELLSSDDMHDALDRAKAIKAHKEAQRAAHLSTDAA